MLAASPLSDPQRNLRGVTERVVGCWYATKKKDEEGGNSSSGTQDKIECPKERRGVGARRSFVNTSVGGFRSLPAHLLATPLRYRAGR